jgi:RNA polymerase sigma factor (sigma-70 family)
MGRDPALAGAVLQSTFTKAWNELREGHELAYPKAWLYAVARNQAIDEVRRRQRLADEPLLYAQADPSRLADPQAVAEDNELVELVWASAAALSPEEYSLLDMHVRHGFGAAEIAEALDLERGAVYTRLSRLRTALEDRVASTLLIRHGGEDCCELEAIVAEHHAGDTLTPELFHAVHTHVEDCPVCGDARRRVVSPVAIFGALIPIVPLAALRDGILAANLPGGAAAGAGAAAAGGTAVVTARHAGKARYLVAGGGVAAAATIATLALQHSHAPIDPAQVASIDHTTGVPSSDRTVTVRWSPGKHAAGYSVMFSRNHSDEPPARENVTGTQYTSAPLEPGRWWFILRTHGKDGGWTDTLRLGPFVITEAVAQPPPVTEKKKVAKHAQRHHQRAHPKHTAVAAQPAARSLVLGTQESGSTPSHQPGSKPDTPRAPPKKKAAPKTPTKKPPQVTAPPTTTSPTGESPPTAPGSTPVVQTPPAGEQGDGEHDDGDDDDQDHDHQGEGGGEGQGGDHNQGDHGNDH